MANPLHDLEAHLLSLAPPSESPSIPGVVLLATTKDPSIPQYSFSCGNVSVSPDRQPAAALSPASTMWFASATKLFTSVAALQLVDRGMWTLDRPVAEALPELASLRELTEWSGDGEPVFADDVDGKSAGASITLRHLLTHTAGMGYDFLNPKIMRLWKWRSAKEGKDVRADALGRVRGEYGLPLVRKPGTAWEYGCSVDWAGALVEKLHGEEEGRLLRVLEREVLGRVGVEEGQVGFRRSDLDWSEEEMTERWADLTARGPDGLVTAGPLPPENAKDDLGGAGLRSSPRDYMKVLESLLRNDGRLLKKETAEEFLFSAQLVEGGLGSHLLRSLNASLASKPAGRMMTGGIPQPSMPDEGEKDEFQFNHSLAGLLCRRKGEEKWSLNWGGAPNIQWFVDPTAGVAGLFATQTLPPADPQMLDLASTFRQNVIRTLGRQQA
jgi:CubicO group peptidase (beta-lactamase class C family)